MPSSKIHNFTEFDPFHQMANGGIRARHNDVQVFQFTEISQNSLRETPLFKTNFYQIGLFSEVCFEVGYFGKPQLINHKNVVVLFKPGQTVQFKKTDPNAKGYAVMFKETFIDWRLDHSNTLKDFSMLNPAVDCVLFLDDAPFADLVDIAQKMYYEYYQNLDGYGLGVLQLYCQLLVKKINRLCALSDTPVASPVQFKTTLDFKTLVYQNIHKTKSVVDYAEMLCLTEKTLVNHFKQSTQTTPKDFINTLIIEESKAMLSNQSTVDQVADYFNFTDQAHFSNFFKKKTGQTPNEYKKR